MCSHSTTKTFSSDLWIKARAFVCLEMWIVNPNVKPVLTSHVSIHSVPFHIPVRSHIAPTTISSPCSSRWPLPQSLPHYYMRSITLIFESGHRFYHDHTPSVMYPTRLWQCSQKSVHKQPDGHVKIASVVVPVTDDISRYTFCYDHTVHFFFLFFLWTPGFASCPWSCVTVIRC